MFGGTAQKIVRYAHCPVLVARPRPGRGRVLAATDFSDAALPAIAAAAEEARRTGARLTAMHAVDVGVSMAAATSSAFGSAYATVQPDVVASLLVVARTMLQDALARLRVEGDVHVTEGAPAAAIQRAVLDFAPEILVLGTAGRTGLRRVFLGSVAESVVRDAACSVLVVRLGTAAKE